MDGRLADAKRSLVAAIGELLASAQRAGAVRTDLDVAELFALLGGVHAAIENAGDTAMAGRLIAIISDGLRAR